MATTSTTKVLTSTPTKEKKKTSSLNKQNRSTIAGTLKRNPKYELKKDELVQLLGRFEAELQAKEIALAALKSEKVKTLLSNARFGRLNCQNDPYSALIRDSEYTKEDVNDEQISMKNAYETQLAQLEELIIQQRKQVYTLKNALDDAERRFLLLSDELENEKREKLRLQTFQNQLLIVQEEKIQLRNEINNIKIHNQDLEKHLIQVMNLLEHEHERHKQFIVLLLNERKIENENYKQQIKQLSNNYMNDDSQRQTQFKQLELENERNKQVLTERIKQLQNEIDLLLKEKKSQTINEEETNDQMTKSRPVLSTQTNNESSPSATNSIRRPTIIPAPSAALKNGNQIKTIAAPSSISTRSQPTTTMTNSTSSIPELPSSPAPPATKRNAIPTRTTSNTNSQSPISSNNIPRLTTGNGGGGGGGGIPRLTKNPQQIGKPTSSTGPAKRPGQTIFPSGHKIDDLRSLLEIIHTATENRLTSSVDIIDSSLNTDKSDLNSPSTIENFFRSAENGDSEQLLKHLKLGFNPNSQMSNGNTGLHLASIHGHIDSIRHLLKFGANPLLENNLGLTSWNNLTKLNETTQLECLQIFVDLTQILPPTDLIFDSIQQNHMSTYGYLLSILHEELKSNPSNISRLLRISLRSTNIHYFECLLAIINKQELIQYIDLNTFISTECLQFLSTLNNTNEIIEHTEPIDLIIYLNSSDREQKYSYAIGKINLTNDLSWLELERMSIKIFIDHITQIDTPFDYMKSSIGCTANHIDTLTLNSITWHYQDSPNNESPMPYIVARDNKSLIIQLKGINTNATDSLAYNYFIPSQNLKNFIRFIEQNSFVGVYGAAYLQKQSLFEDLMRYFERPIAFSSSQKFKIIRFQFETITSLDDFIEELIEQGFLHSRLRSNEQHSSMKYLLYFSNVQNSVGSDAISLLLNSEAISDTCQKLSYSREENSRSIVTYYFPSNFHIFLTMSKRTWSTEQEIYKKFKWIPFKIDNSPWNGLLKRHLWRRMIDINIRENRSVDNELIRTLHWIANVWQKYNECLQKLSLQDALLGPGLFFDCPMENDSIYEWLQMKWNTIVAPLVRELSMNKCAQPKSKMSTTANAAATAIASSLRANSLEISTPYESVACTALYVLLHRAISRDCPLTGHEREQYLLNFVGSRLEGGGSASLMSSAASSRASTPQPSNYCEFVSIQLE